MENTIKKVISVSLLFCPLIFLWGCGASIETQNYQDPLFAEYNIKKISVLPVRNTNLNVSNSTKINRYFMTQISRKTSKYEFIGPEESIEILNKDTLTEMYFNYLITYSTTGIPNRDIIKKIGTSLNTDAIVQGEIFSIKKKDMSVWSDEQSEVSFELRYSMVATKDGKLLWETNVEANEKASFFSLTNNPPALMDLIMEAMDKVLESVPF